MPSATSLPGLSLSNLGPLTTTYTAPASCATQAVQTVLVYKDVPGALFMDLSCDKDVSYDGCFPSGSAFDKQDTRSIITPGITTLLYYSPATACPSDWATVGLASRDAEGTLTSSGPAFALPTVTEGPFADRPLAEVLGYNPGNNQMMGALDPEETLVMCCPSSMKADIYGNCQSELPPFPMSTACPHVVVREDVPDNYTNSTFSVFGTTVTGEQLSWGTKPISIEPSTSALYTAQTSLLTGAAYMPMIMMAHRASATPAPTAGTGTGNPAPDSTGDQATAAPTSAATALAPLWLSALGLAAGLAAVVAM